ncbi:MAG: zinc-ribbon domain-containing protein [Gemmataceae bacterium]|nr:zinc-ribbon domain-containing protein [Gemmataceae bacterium]MDW8265666.1 hypothetical protein [Gemmataceae bacterium]
MNILCPNCQKQLQVPDQFAGQLMKCPLCEGAFTVPSLPKASVGVGTGPESARRMPPPPPLGGGATAKPKPDGAPKPTVAPTPVNLSLERRVALWIAPGALAAVLLLTFFPWYGMYPNGENVGSTNAWGAAFGSNPSDEVWSDINRQDRSSSSQQVFPVILPFDASSTVGYGYLLLPFLLLFLPAALLLSVASALVSLGRLAVPPPVQPLLPLRSILLAAVIVLAFLALCMQAVIGFPLENAILEVAQHELSQVSPDMRSTPEKRRAVELRMHRTLAQFGLRTTVWFHLTLLLLIVALGGTLFDYWLSRRGDQAPPLFQWKRWTA